MKIIYTILLVFAIHYNLMADWIFQSSGTYNSLQSVHFVNQNIGYIVGLDGTILKTTNGGTDWIPQTGGNSHSLRTIFFSDADNGWAAGDVGIILHTTNGGGQWFSQTSGTTKNLYQAIFIDSLHGWIAGDSGVMLYTPNGGTSWISLTTGLNSLIRSVNFINLNYGWAVGALGKIIYTTNGGVQWINQSSGTTEFLNSVFFTDLNNGWTVGHGGTILHTTNGGNEWIIQTSGYSFTFPSVHFTSPLNGWAVGLSGTILHTTNGGNNWFLDFDAGYNHLNSVSFVDSLNGWTVGEQGTICKYSTSEIGIDWCNLQEPDEYTMSTYDSVEIFARVFVDSITILPGPCHDILAWIGFNTENTDPLTWSNWTPADYQQDIGANDEYSAYLSGLDANIYYYASRFQIYGTEFYYGGYPNGFWDGVDNISGILNVLPYHVIQWCNLAAPSTYTMTKNDSVEVYAQVFVDGVTNIPGQGNGILSWIGYSNENGDPATWSNWIPANYSQDIGGNDEYSQYLTSLDTGIYYYASKFQIEGGDYYYGGYPNGFWNGVTNVSGVLIVNSLVNADEIKSKIFNFYLDQNYPNPFNPSTKIKYEIPEQSFVSIKVYDVLGNEVATLMNEERLAGSYEVEFNVGQDSSPDIASGIYFYRIQAGNFVETMKMILLK